VTGGAGGVGYYAVQLAKWGGATVIATVSSPIQAEFVRAAGADYVINYKTEDVAAHIKELTQAEDGRGVDRIIEVNFGSNLAVSNAVLKQNGVISTYASGERPDVQPPLPFYQMLRGGGTIHFVFVYLMPEAAHQSAITDITTCLEAGALHHNIAHSFELKEVAAAHDAVDSGKAGGKVVVEVA
jgi:NADPH2:quinone reductase